MPGSPGLQAISFNTSCEIEIARNAMQTAGQVGTSWLSAGTGLWAGWRTALMGVERLYVGGIVFAERAVAG